VSTHFPEGGAPRSVAGKLIARARTLGDVFPLQNYDGLGRLAWQRDERGNETTVAYDQFGRVTSQTLPSALLHSSGKRHPAFLNGNGSFSYRTVGPEIES